MDAAIRLQNELQNLRKNRPFGMYARPLKRDIFHWTCQIYNRGYYYQLTLKFSHSYPVVPPTVVFANQMFHPNIYESNHVCLDLVQGRWIATLTIKDVLLGLTTLLDNPNPDSPANSKAAKLYKKDIQAYNKKVEELNKKYYSKYMFVRE